ncbi:hypothetical protein [Cytobacillus sp.]|nr:hypothetical protein [Cytobacillus sp.]
MEQYRINPSEGMEFGLYSLGDHIPNPITFATIDLISDGCAEIVAL